VSTSMSIFIIYGNQLPPKKAKKKRNQFQLARAKRFIISNWTWFSGAQWILLPTHVWLIKAKNIWPKYKTYFRQVMWTQLESSSSSRRIISIPGNLGSSELKGNLCVRGQKCFTLGIINAAVGIEGIRFARACGMCCQLATTT